MPDGWAWCRVGSITQFIRNGANIKQDKEAQGYPITRIETISNGEINTEKFGYANIFELEKFEKYLLHIDDILMSHINSPVHLGKSAIYDGNYETPIIHGMNLLCIRLVEKSSSYYLLYAFRTSLFKDFVWENMKQAVNQASITTASISSFLLPLAPFNEQRRITKTIKQYTNLIDRIENDKTNLQQILSVTKSKILDLAIRGKLVPQDPNDEPASVLLERIRAEKEELIKQGKIKRDKKESVIFKGDDNSYYEKIGDEITCIDDEIPFEIPENWFFSRLKNIWELISGRDLSPSDYNDTEDGIPYITGASNFINGKVNLVRWTPKPQVITYYGDLLMTCKRTIGEIAINDFGEAHIARQIMAIRNIYNLNIDYLSLCLQFYIESIKQSAKGLIPGISREDVLNIILPVPPNKYQVVVVEAIQKYKEILNSTEANLN